jgi:hypothetical protein
VLDIEITRKHIVISGDSDIAALSPELSYRFTTGELNEVHVSPDIEKLRLPHGARCSYLFGDRDGTEVYLTDSLRVETCDLRTVKGAEGSKLNVFTCDLKGTLAVQYVEFHRSLDSGLAVISVQGAGMVGAVYTEDLTASAVILGPNGRETLSIGVMDDRHERRGKVQVKQLLNDAEIAAMIGPLSSRHRQLGPQELPGEQRYRWRGRRR